MAGPKGPLPGALGLLPRGAVTGLFVPRKWLSLHNLPRDREFVQPEAHATLGAPAGPSLKLLT